MRRVLGSARVAWDDLEAHLGEACGLNRSLHFMYGKRYGWAVRFRRGGRTIAAMYPNDGHLTVQIILSRAQVATARTMRLPRNVSKVLEAATDYPEGRWLFIPVRSRKDAQELKALIALKLTGRATGR